MDFKLLGQKVNVWSFDEAVSIAVDYIKNRKFAQVVTINPEMFQYANKNKDFAKILNEAEMVIPDGVGVIIGLKLNGAKAERIPGIDFARKLLEISAKENFKVAIIGSKQEVIEKAVNNLKSDIQGINIIYSHNGYFSNDNEIYEDLVKTNPDLVLVAMGSPRQEEFIYNAKKLLNPCLMVGIGGSLDVWSGTVKRAPLIFQKTGTEWLYRTITQPSRIKRIFPTLPMFIIKALMYKYKNQE